VSGVSRNRGSFCHCVAIQKRLGIPGLNFKIIKTRRFERWILLPFSSKKGRRGQELCWASWLSEPQTWLPQPGGLRDRVSFLFSVFYQKTEGESSFRDVVILLFFLFRRCKMSKNTILCIIKDHRQKSSDFTKNVCAYKEQHPGASQQNIVNYFSILWG
jgi:hypothetical protein